MIIKPTIIENLLDQNVADEIEDVLLHNAPWHLITDITYGTGSNERATPAVGHVFVNTEWNKNDDDFLELVRPIIDEACKKINYKYHNIQKARSFLQMPLHENFTNTKVDALHTDQPYTHLVVLYYVMDSDGDTILVDHIREGEARFDLEAEDFEEMIRVTPQKNKCVVFDGDVYHTAEQPQDGLRCIINFNLLGEFVDG